MMVQLFVGVVVSIVCLPPFLKFAIRLASNFVRNSDPNQVYLSTADGNNAYDVIIVGAGCAGCPLAMLLAQNGLKLLLLDRDFDLECPMKKIIGEYMQPAGMEKLRKFGLADCALDADACPSFGYAIIKPISSESTNGYTYEELLARYPTRRPRSFWEQVGFGMQTRQFNSEQLKEVYPPTAATKHEESVTAWCFHYDAFIRRLREKCRAHPNITCLHATMDELAESHGKVDGVEFIMKNGSRYSARAPLTVLCDGGANFKWRKVMGLRKSPRLLSTWIGVGLRHEPWKPPLSYPAHGNLVLTYPSPVVLYQNSPSDTRMLVCVDDYSNALENATSRDKILLSCYDKSGQLDHIAYLENVIAPQLPRNMADALLSVLKPSQCNDNIAAQEDLLIEMNPGGKTPPTASSPLDASKPRKGDLIYKNCYTAEIPQKWHKEGLVAVGDSFSMRHAITGGGMTATLNDVDIIYRSILATDLNCPTASKTIMWTLARERRKTSATLNVLANALHRVLCRSPGPAFGTNSILLDACFSYMGKSEFTKCGTLGLISGFSTHSLVLIYHFWSVAAGAVGKIIREGLCCPSEILPNVYQTMCHAVCLLMPHVTQEHCSFLSSWPFRKLLDLMFGWEDYARTNL